MQTGPRRVISTSSDSSLGLSTTSLLWLVFFSMMRREDYTNSRYCTGRVKWDACISYYSRLFHCRLLSVDLTKWCGPTPLTFVSSQQEPMWPISRVSTLLRRPLPECTSNKSRQKSPVNIDVCPAGLVSSTGQYFSTSVLRIKSWSDLDLCLI